MATVAKTIIATGASSGLGFEAMKQLLQTPQPYQIIIGARNTSRTQSAYNTIPYNREDSSVVILPLELSNLKEVKTFAHRALEVVNQGKIDYLLLNAAIHGTADGPGPYGSQWCEPYIVNHLSQHYLLHLLRDNLVKSRSRIIVVSSGAIRAVPDDLTTLSTSLKAGADTNMQQIYCMTKFIQLLGAHWWRRQLSGSCKVVAVSPGLVPDTGLMAKHKDQLPDFSKVPDAISVPKGGENILRAFNKSDFPEDKDLIFLTSWGEWWGKDVIGRSCDQSLQEKWSPSRETIEQEVKDLTL